MQYPVTDLKKTLEAALEIDPKAGYQFEDHGSGTCVLTVFVSEEAAKTLTHEQLNELDRIGLHTKDEDDLSVEDRLVERCGFFILL